MKQLIEEGVRKYDFLAGEPGYKARWAAQAGHYVNYHFARPFSLGSAYLRGVHHAKQGKEWLRAQLPKGAWDLLHKINLKVHGKSLREMRQGSEPSSMDEKGQTDSARQREVQNVGADKKD